jgi:hypothetical protein
LIGVFWLIKLFKNSKEHETYDEPNTNFLQHVVIQNRPLPD